MREGARVVADWVELQRSPLPTQTIADAAKKPAGKPTEVSANVGGGESNTD
jgi:hypothetical protein